MNIFQIGKRISRTFDFMNNYGLGGYCKDNQFTTMVGTQCGSKILMLLGMLIAHTAFKLGASTEFLISVVTPLAHDYYYLLKENTS